MNPDEIATVTATGWQIHPGYIVATLVTAIGSLFALLYKRNRPEIGTEGSLYDAAVATIRRQTAELAEKDTNIAALHMTIAQLHAQRNDADTRASRATAAAEIAQEALKRAVAAAEAAAEECREMQAARNRDQQFIAQLRAALLTAGIPLPPEPVL